jgi:hypothetical protein
MNVLVRILIDDDGTKIDKPVWHLLETEFGDPHALCTGEYVGGGESSCVFETKEVKRGIECKACVEIIKRHKKVKL